ncbi:hypothetical protein BJ944DRAFT_285007 [Cunninghamella echinulata]|nr:hypothetical protein BJ944DRAFT_285007 [Cunninghamella echinulata]
MANIIGQYVQVNLNNQDIIYGKLSSVDPEDKTLSLENVKRCFSSGRKSEYPFMKVPGHMIQNYVVASSEESSENTQQQQQYPISPPDPPKVDPTQQVNTGPPPPTVNSKSTKPTFNDPAIITLVTGNQQTTNETKQTKEAKEAKETKSKKQHNNTAKSNKNKKEIVISVENKKESSPKQTKFNNTSSNNNNTNNKSKRNNKIKPTHQQQTTSSTPPANDNVEGKKKKATVPSSPPSSNATAEYKDNDNNNDNNSNSNTKTINNQQQQKPKSPSTPKKQHVIPHFTSKSSKNQQRKLIETVVYEDYSEFYKADGKVGHKKITKTAEIPNEVLSSPSTASPPPPSTISTSATHPLSSSNTGITLNNLPMPISPTSVVLTSDNISPITNSPHLHKPDDAVNQEATQSLLFSLNLKPMIRQPSNPNNILSASSSVFSLNDSISSGQHNNNESFDFTRRSSSRHGSISQETESIRKLSNASDVKVPSSLIPPKLRTRSSIKHDLLHHHYHNNNTDDHGTPTQMMQPVIDDIMLTATDMTSSSSSIGSKSMTKTFTLEQQDSSYKEKLQKPMEEQPKDDDDFNSSHSFNEINMKQLKSNNAGPRIISTATGTECPVLTVDHLLKLIKNTKKDTGLTDTMIIENAAYATATITFKIIGGQRRVQQGNHNAAPIVVIFAGNHNIGSYGLATARHLANRGIQVIVLIVGHESTLCPNILQQKKCAEFSGAQFVYSIDDLPDPMIAPIDLIIDGLMGSTSSMDDLKKDHTTRTVLWQCIDWSNSNKAPVLSLDFPSGVNPKDGHPYHIMHYIQPKWTLCFGAPVQGCNSDKTTGSLFVADIGIPIVSWQRIGIHGNGFPWGNEFVIPLEYEN